MQKDSKDLKVLKIKVLKQSSTKDSEDNVLSEQGSEDPEDLKI